MKTTIRRSMTVIASAAALLIATEASAADGVEATQAYCIPEGVSTQGGFLTEDGAPDGTLQLNNALIEDGTLKLTKRVSGAAGTAYYKKFLDLSAKENEASSRPFHVFFSFSIKVDEADKATGKVGSGLAFLAQNQSLFKTGANENALGYGDIAPSLAIELDTHTDPEPEWVTMPDPQGDHIGFMLNGDPDEHAAYYLPGGDLAGFNGFTSDKSKKWFVWVDYTGTEVLVYLSDKKEVKPSKPITWKVSPDALETPNNFNAAEFIRGMKMSDPAAWFGFSAANYGVAGMSVHSIHEWELSNEGIPCACQGESACPESLRACSAGKNTLDRGICVECTAGNTSACDAKGEICTTGEVCGPCSKDADCNGHPSGNRCALTGPREGKCVECRVDAHCPGARPICDQATNACIECTEDAQCPGEEPVCNPTSHTCEPCDSDADCSGRPATPVCAVSGEQKGMCVPKVCKACPEGTVCNGNACVPIDSIEGGGFACTASGGSSAASDGARSVAGIMGALGIAAAVARRRRRSGKGA
jgi:MYXO-CTERM domain-containing protein